MTVNIPPSAHQVTNTVWSVSSPTFSVLFATEELAQAFHRGISTSNKAIVCPISVVGPAPQPQSEAPPEPTCRYCTSDQGHWEWYCGNCGRHDDTQDPAPHPLQLEGEYVEHTELSNDAVRIIKDLGFVWKDGSWHGRVWHEPVAEIVECPVMGQQTVQEIDGRWKFLQYGDKLYTSPQSIIDDLLGVLQQITELHGIDNAGPWAVNIASSAIFRASQRGITHE